MGHTSIIERAASKAHYGRQNMSKVEDYRNNFDETEEFLSGMIAALDEMDGNLDEAWGDAKYDLYRTVGNAVSDYWEATRIRI